MQKITPASVIPIVFAVAGNHQPSRDTVLELSEPNDIPPLVIRLCEWMRKQRGARDSTLAGYGRVLCKLVQALGSEPRRYTGSAAACVLFERDTRIQPQQSRYDSDALRMFVRFVVVHGECAEGLLYAIPRLAVFRHSAATAWLRQGLSLQAVGSVPRHRDVDTTALYVKVDHWAAPTDRIALAEGVHADVRHRPLS